MEKGKRYNDINICDLPDEILQKILSNLPTKEAIRTGALSKRWIDQWSMDLSTIDLEEQRDEKRQEFIQLVERLLVACEPSHIKKLSLVYKVDDNVQKVNEWLGGFINPTVQEVNVDVGRVEEPLVFPEHLFTSETLTKLKLCMKHVINLPSSISFSNLNTLTLKDVIFPNSSSTQQIFSSCPSLKELSLIGCNWMNVKCVCIACPLLQKFIIRECKDDFDENDMNATNKCDIIIIGSNLRTFSFDGDLVNDYLLYGTTSVNNATIGVKTWNDGIFVFKLLTMLPNVQKLSLLGFAMEAVYRTYSLVVQLPLFQKLVELHVDYSSGPPTLFPSEAFMALLRKAPILKVVSFVMGESLHLYGKSNNVSLPVCFETHLKTIKIYKFSGKEGELNVIQFMLQNALVLDEIYIYIKDHEFDSNAGSKRLNILMKQIGQFPKAAADCDVIFK